METDDFLDSTCQKPLSPLPAKQPPPSAGQLTHPHCCAFYSWIFMGRNVERHMWNVTTLRATFRSPADESSLRLSVVVTPTVDDLQSQHVQRQLVDMNNQNFGALEQSPWHNRLSLTVRHPSPTAIASHRRR